MVTEIFETITDIITSFLGTLTSSLGEVVKVFYTAGVGSEPGQLTFIGILALLGVGVGLVWTIFGLVRNFIKMRG